MAIEIVDLPTENRGSFQFATLVYQRGISKKISQTCRPRFWPLPMISHLVLFGGRDLLVDLRIIGVQISKGAAAWGMQPNNGGQASDH